jgi:hypothetical protein
VRRADSCFWADTFLEGQLAVNYDVRLVAVGGRSSPIVVGEPGCVIDFRPANEVARWSSGARLSRGRPRVMPKILV